MSRSGRRSRNLPRSWHGYLAAAVDEGLWARPGLAPRQRSLITIAALATLGSQAELKAQIQAAPANGLRADEILETLLQVAGYAGLGRALDALTFVGEVSDQGAPLACPSETATSRARGEEVLLAMRPDLEGHLYDVPTEAPTEWRDWLPEWQRWLVSTAFGGLYSRGTLSLDERERVTFAVIVALGHDLELRQHVKICVNLGISQAEIGEQIMHLAAYVGFPAAVKAIRTTTEVLVELSEAGDPTA
jgi:4-carboxymuconolactone decarboxylase